MLEQLADRWEKFLDDSTALLWELFEKDMAMTEAILRRADSLIEKILGRR